jgi:hypothetical protein
MSTIEEILRRVLYVVPLLGQDEQRSDLLFKAGHKIRQRVNASSVM